MRPLTIPLLAVAKDEIQRTRIVATYVLWRLMHFTDCVAFHEDAAALTAFIVSAFSTADICILWNKESDRWERFVQSVAKDMFRHRIIPSFSFIAPPRALKRLRIRHASKKRPLGTEPAPAVPLPPAKRMFAKKTGHFAKR